MASLGKREFAKKDMNFFSEFAASSQQMARIMGYMIIGGIVVVGLLVALCVFQIIRLGIIKAEVKYYDNLFQTEEYQTMQLEADELSKKAEHVNEYAYVMANIVKSVDKETGVQFEIYNEIKTHIPSTCILTDIEIDKGVVTIKGESDNYYAPTEIANMLQANDYFTNVNSACERYDITGETQPEQMMYSYINAHYDFEIVGNLLSKYCVSVTSVTEENKIIKVDNNEMIDAGSVYTKEGIASITVAGDTYNLSAILINGVAISDDNFQDALTADKFSVSINTDTSIELQYTVQAAEQVEEEA